MLADHVRDIAVTAAVFGFFAPSWFGWAQEAPPRRWRPFLIAGTVVSLLPLIAGIVIALRHRDDGTVFDDATSRIFGIVVGIEFAAAGLGAILLAVRRRRELIPVWIAFVVGVHLFPVAAIIGYPVIHVVGAVVTVAALIAVPVARARDLAPSAVVGSISGTALLAGALFSAVAAATG